MLEALEASGPAVFFRASAVLYPLVNALHILSIGALVTTAILMDLRILGLGRALPAEKVLATLRPIAYVALAGAVVTGATLFSVQATEYVENTAFQVKMLLLAAALGNAMLFAGLRLGRTGDAPAARVMALVSVGLWLSVLAAGRFIGFTM
jgi:hypothetical protein